MKKKDSLLCLAKVTHVCHSKITMLFIYILLFSQLKKKKDNDILTLINLY